MKLEVFEKIVALIDNQQERSRAAYALGIDLMDFEETYSTIITHLLKAYYGEVGEDWISWYIYERDRNNGDPNQAWDKDGNPICYDVPSLWKHVEEIRCSDEFVEYELKKRSDNATDFNFMVNLFGGL
jgi:hypothetical protein